MKVALRTVLALLAAVIAWLLLAGLNRTLERRLAARAAADTTRVPAAAWEPAGPLTAPRAPIAGEALVFRARPLAAGSTRRPDAHPRTLATYRALRAYPGAPPRVPHGLTAEEFRGSTCNTCHEHGGYSPRFSAYVPVTPHPEQQACLQCHATDAAMTAVALPDDRPDARCRQCHTPGRAAPDLLAPEWRPAAWPAVVRARPDGIPPDIPHTLQLRGDCLACHTGPGAVREIRTTHPERASCRQCHLAPVEDRAWSGEP